MVIKMSIKMLNYSLKINRWISDNVKHLDKNELTTSGHIDDILKLKTMSKDKLTQNGFILRSDTPPHLKMFEKHTLLRASLLLLENSDLSKLHKQKELLLYIFLKESKFPDIKDSYNFNQIVNSMNYTPPEFIILDKKIDTIYKKEIHIKELNDKLNSYGYAIFDEDEKLYYKYIVIYKK